MYGRHTEKKKKMNSQINNSHKCIDNMTLSSLLGEIFMSSFSDCFARSESVISCCCEKGISAPRCDEDLCRFSEISENSNLHANAGVNSHGFTGNP